MNTLGLISAHDRVAFSLLYAMPNMRGVNVSKNTGYEEDNVEIFRISLSGRDLGSMDIVTLRSKATRTEFKVGGIISTPVTSIITGVLRPYPDVPGIEYRVHTRCWCVRLFSDKIIARAMLHVFLDYLIYRSESE